MTATRLRWYCLLGLLLAYPTDGYGQPRKVDVGGPLAGPVILNAPFSADAVMVVKMAFSNGERLEKTNTAKYYRDSADRSRVEHVSSTAAQSTSTRGVPTVIDGNRSARLGEVWILDEETREARIDTRALLGLGMGGDAEYITVALGGRRFVDFPLADEIHRFLRLPEEWVQREALGTRHIEGVAAVGTRVTLTVPPSTLRKTGPDSRAATIVDEQWGRARAWNPRIDDLSW